MDDYSGKRVMVAEDNKLIRNKMEEKLQKANLKFDSFENGKIALDKFKENKYYYLLITDIEIPEMRGTELAKEVKEISDISYWCSLVLLMIKLKEK